MKRYVTDTQCLLWYLADDRRLPRGPNRAFKAADEGNAQVAVPKYAAPTPAGLRAMAQAMADQS